MDNYKNRIFENLNGPQKEAVQTPDGPILVLAGAGSGKTRTIVHKISYLLHEKMIPAYRIVAVTFTNKAALEMSERTHALCGPESSGVVIRTYHALGLYLLRKLAHYMDYPDHFTIWDDLDTNKAIESTLKKISDEKFTKNQIKYFATSINSFKNDLILPNELKEKADLENMEYGELMENVFHLYEETKKESHAVDFGDLISMPVYIFEKYPEALEEIQRRYHYFLVDEYQDTNYAQYKMISLLSSKSRNLCVVGDDDQAIYGWRGADVRNILNFRNEFPDAKVIKLEENYRSTSHILDLANHVIQNNEDRMDKTLWSKKENDFESRLYIEKSDKDEASRIMKIIRQEATIIPYEEIGILYRTNSQSRLIEEALLNAKIPYIVYGGISFFARKEIKDMLAYLQIIANPFNEMAFLRMVNTPARGMGEKTIAKLLQHRLKKMQQENLAISFIHLMRNPEAAGISGKAAATMIELSEWLDEINKKAALSVDLSLLFEDIMIRSGLKTEWEDEDKHLGTSRIEHTMELKNSIMNFQISRPDARLEDFLQEISLFSNAQEMNESDRRGVQLMTVHNAKGLEFGTVIIAGMDDTVFPHFFAINEGRIDEERRLIYVAITRAKNHLYMTRAQRRMKYSGVELMSPSVFLAEIDLSNMKVISNLEEENSSSSFSSGYRKSFYNSSHTPGSSKQNSLDKFPNSVDNASSAKYKFSGTDKSGNKIKKGDNIAHPSFGEGIVIKVEGRGESAKIHILFKNGSTKKFLAKFAQLDIL